MLYRIIPALPILALAGCHPYYSYPQYYGANPYAYRGYAPAASSPSLALATAGSTVPARAPGVSGIAILPPALLGGAFHEIDPRSGIVGFWNDDPVRRKDVARYPGRYVERVTLKNGGVLIYETLSGGDLAGVSDGDLIRTDLELSGFRQRGIGFDATKLAQTGAFTYLAQSSRTDGCFVFRAKLQPAGRRAGARAYGNLCAAKSAADIAALKAEMLYVLSHLRLADSATNDLLMTAAPAAAPAAAVAPALGAPTAITAPPLAAAADGEVTMSLAQCGYEVKFSGMPALGEPGGSEYTFQNAGYSEKASCSCRKDLDYSKVSEFDAVDNLHARTEKAGFTLQKATFDETPELGKELAFEALRDRNSTDTFLVGRDFFHQCGFTVEATGASYGDLVKARKFIDSVAARPEAPPLAETASNAVIGSAARSAAIAGSSAAPAAAPRTPVATAELSTAVEKTAAEKPVAGAAVTPAAASAAAVETGGSDATATRLRRLQLLLDQKLITPGEYDAKRKSILDSL